MVGSPVVLRVVNPPDALGLIAGNGQYPHLLARSARAAGVRRIAAVAFTGETEQSLADLVDEIEWLRVGQLSAMIGFLRNAKVTSAIMAGQIAPRNLFDLRPDWRALLLLAKLKRRNAESIFNAIGHELTNEGVSLLPATTFLEHLLAERGPIAGPRFSRRQQADIDFGLDIARQIAGLDIGQTVIVRNGTVLAVEGLEGTNEAMRRGGALGRRDAVMIKIAKPRQDMRFDVPVIGNETIRIAAESKIRVIALEAGKTLLLEKEAMVLAAQAAGISVLGV